MKTPSTLSITHENGTLEIPDSTLIVGIDETGEEWFSDKKYPVFGLGGCAVMAKDYFRYLDDPWLYLKETYFGGQSTQLHASELHHPTKEQLKVLEHFFTNLPFFRFVTMAAKTLKNETIETNVHLISHSVLQQVAEFAKWVQPTEIVFIIESSRRIGRDLLKHFSAYRFGNGEIEIAPRAFLASKKVRASCVEVADFVIHPAGAQVRNRLRGFKNTNNLVRKDFEIVFNKVDRKLVSYKELLSAKIG
jgi:hypothetical protein